MIVAQSPQLLGIGVDEDTAAVVDHVDDREVLTVVGRGAVTIFDPSHIQTNAYEARRSSPLLASGVVLHVLPDGAQFDLTSRTLIPAPTAIVDPVEAAELAEAHQDLRQLARDIAAADASPTALKRRLARSRKQPATPTPTQDGVS